MVDITVKFLLIWIKVADDVRRYNFWLKYKKYVFRISLKNSLFFFFDDFHFAIL